MPSPRGAPSNDSQRDDAEIMTAYRYSRTRNHEPRHHLLKCTPQVDPLTLNHPAATHRARDAWPTVGAATSAHPSAALSENRAT